MNSPKLHHYVPRFYLERFTDPNGRLWAWDKMRDVSFHSSPAGVAAENHFYRQDDLAELGHDPLTLEKQLADIEGQIAKITSRWIEWLGETPARKRIQVPKTNRDVVALFLCLQYLRTRDAREILSALAASGRTLLATEQRRLHTSLLWDEPTFRQIADHFYKSIWVFGRNKTSTPFLTSDNPITFRTADHRQWVRVGIQSRGVYAGYPLTPEFILFCYDGRHWKWKSLQKFDCSVSPVVFTDKMVESENTGQVFMASRFVFSNVNHFEEAQDFANAIKTNRYAPRSN